MKAITMISRRGGTLLAQALIAIGFSLPLSVFAQSTAPAPLAPQTQMIAVSGAPAPTQETFTIPSPAEDLVVTFTDLQTPVALSSASIVVTRGASIVAMTPMGASATSSPPLAISGAVGQYTLYVIGTPGAGGVGTFSVCVAPKTAPTACISNASIAGNITEQTQPANPTVSSFAETLTVATAGTYTFAFADQQFPVPLVQGTLSIALFQGSTAIQLAIPSGTPIVLAKGTYTLLAVAQADPTAKAGLFGLTVSGPVGVAPLVSSAFPVGLLGPASQASNPSVGQTLTLTVTDFAFPAALGGASALVTAGGTALGPAVSAGSGPSSFSAPAGSLQVWSYGTAGTGAGTYEVDLTSPSASLLQAAFGVNSGSSLAYAYVSPKPLASGSYQATANDFEFPVALASMQFAVAQNGAILKQQSTVGSLNFTAAAAPVVLLAVAIPTNGNGMFDVNVQTGGNAPQLVFDHVQTVSASGNFTSQTITLGVSGNFDATLQDLLFPAQFLTLGLVGTSDGAVLGKIYGGGTFTIAATPGNYQVTIVAIPAAQQQYGLYGIQIVDSPPTVTLTASPTTVAAGGTTTLSWTTANATACTASGGSFTGAQPSGTNMLAVVVSATTTYTLSCTGPGGGPVKGTATVTATAPAPASSGGGGGVGLGMVGLLGLFALARMGLIALRKSARL